jgi:putative ABC transport system permease protein
MLSPRWRKIIRDLWRNKGRTLLVVLSIAVGVFAVGTVAHMRTIVRQDMRDSYASANPASATIYTEQSFDDDPLEVVRDMPEVAAAEGRRSVMVRFQFPGDEQWRPMQVIAIPDYEDMRVNILRLEGEHGPDPAGWPGPVPLPPPDRELMFERTSLLRPDTGLYPRAKLGGTLLIETPAGKQREMRMAGLVADFARYPASFMNMPNAYVTLNTMEWLGLPRDYNELPLLVAGDRMDAAYIERVADRVADRIERGGVTVLRTSVPEPGRLPLEDLVDALVYLLGALGALSLLSSGFLLVNTMQALLAQQVRQIGVMKAVGARGRHIVGMYLSIILFYGILALVLSVPLGTWAAREIIGFMTYFVNFELSGFRVPPEVLALEVGMALLVPVAAGFWPVIAGTRITVREAISNYGLGKSGFGTGFVDQIVERVRGLPRPLLLSIRNTFRRKGRLLLTLATLTLAGTVFIAVIAVRASLMLTLDNLFRYYKWDAEVSFERPYRAERVEGIAMSVPGVTAVESWIIEATYRLRPDDSEGDVFLLRAPPAETETFDPTVIEGRWLRPEDENALVVNTHWLDDEPDVAVGDEVVIDVHGREATWRVVGVVRPAWPAAEAYVNYDYFTRVIRSAGQAGSVYVVTERHDAATHARVKEALRDRFDREGLKVNLVQTVAENRANNAVFAGILTTFLMSMAVLLAVVGGIGLMGTMLLNVLERIREVGVMRAIGAKTEAVLQIFIVEGVIIGLISWLLATILAMSLGRTISSAVGMTMWGFALDYAFPLSGVLIWLILAVLLSVAASYLPAQNATRITVRDVLAYY